MLKRVGLFIITNLAIMAMVTIVINVFGLEPHLNAYGQNYQSLLIFCAIFGMGGALISLQMSRWTAKKFMGVQLIESNGHHSGLYNTIERLSKAANLPATPEVGIFDSPEVNAFATGPSKSKSLVAVSTGLLNNMTTDEVEGVLAHEIAHIANGDMVTLTLIQGVVNTFVMFFARIAAFAVQNALNGDDEEGEGSSFWVNFALVMVFQLVFGLLGSVVVAFFSRYREYRADSGGARLAGREKMIAALKRLDKQFEAGAFDKHADNQSVNAMKISSRGSKLAALLSTHPPLKTRIKALEMNA
jgi:heat shock protein HtpX